MKLVDFINDPVHAFFGFLGAIILSIFGAFIKDLLLNTFSRSSKWWKAKRDKEQKERDAIVEKLVNSQPYLILYCTRTVLSNISIAVMFIMLLGTPTFLKMTQLSESVSPIAADNVITISHSTISLNTILQFLGLLFVLFIALTGIVLSYSVSKRNLIIARATKMISASLKPENSNNSISTEEPGSSIPANNDEVQGTAFAQDERTISSHKSQVQPSSKSEANTAPSSVYARRIMKDGRVFEAKNGKLYVIPKNSK